MNRRRIAALALGFSALALRIRLPSIGRVGAVEGGGDEWYSVWRCWAVLTEGGNPGNYQHPALFYDLGGALFAAIGWAGRYRDRVELLAAFVRDEARFLRDVQYLSAVFGAAAVGVTFVLGRRLYGALAGAVSAALLAVLPLHVEYSQRVRVDALFVLGVAASGWALLQVHERGNRRDWVLAGVVIGLTIAANYPGMLLLLPAAWLGRRSWRDALLGLAAVIAVGLATNPTLVANPAAVWEGFRSQASMAWNAHPYREDVSRLYYWRVLWAQGPLFLACGGASIAWSLARDRGFARVLAASALSYVLVFAVVRTQFDRYVLPPLPWVCVLIGGMLARWPRPLALVAAMALVGGAAWKVAPRITPQAVDPNSEPRRVLARWYLTHARPGTTVWLEADVWPLLQATFADPGGPLQAQLKRAFRRAYPGFDVTVLKGERVERSSNFDPSLVANGTIQYAITCNRYVEYASRERPGEAAFYGAIARSCRHVFEAPDGCWIADCAR